MIFYKENNSFSNRESKDIILKKQTGITLVALVVTIIVLLILASITIATISGNSGILNESVEAKRTAEEISNMSEINALIQEEKLKNGGKINYSNFTSNTNKIVKFLNNLGYEYNNNGLFLAGSEAIRIAEDGNIVLLTLPKGYTQLEYIKSTGTQYIDTKVKNTRGFKASLLIELVAMTTRVPTIIGCSLGGETARSIIF